MAWRLSDAKPLPGPVLTYCQWGHTTNSIEISIEIKTFSLKKYVNLDYRKVSNIRRTLVGNKIVDHSDVVGASPVGAAPTTSSFSTQHLASRDSAKTAARRYENILSVGIWCVLY